MALVLSWGNDATQFKTDSIDARQERWARVSSQVMSMEEIVEMADAYEVRKLEEAYETAFSKMTPLRTEPRAYEPQKPLTPWYLDKNSGGPNPVYRKPGIKYQD